MISFLFWNVHQQPLAESISHMARFYNVDFVLLAECPIEPPILLAALNSRPGPPYCLPWSEGKRILVYTRLPEDRVTDQFNDAVGRLTVRQVKIGGLRDILLAVIHFPSRLRWDRSDQNAYISEVAADIIKIEDSFGHSRTILVGDLNMNPFDEGVVMAQGLHAVMTKAQAKRGGRHILGRHYRYFYNPMWGHFGDRTDGPAGTYYRQTTSPVDWFWYMLDQVLLRPSLMDSLIDVRILDSDGQNTLLTANGRPNGASRSDHLPILFRLAL
jgi:hypothetical protein